MHSMATQGRSTRRFLQIFTLLVLLTTLPGFVLAAGLPSPDLEKLRQEIKENDWSFEVNDNFSRTLTPEQRLNLRSGFVMTEEDKREMEKNLVILPMSKDPLPSNLDWRDVGGITPVKSQGSCGSCWAFAATAELEAFVKIYYGVEMDFSEQQSVSCNPYGAGCDGGWASASYYVFQQYGAVTEGCMPYLLMDPPEAPCIQNDYKKYGFINGYRHISNDVEQIKLALQDGPVCTGIDASDAFEAYSGGCFDEISYSTNHLVLIVGYDDRSCGGTGGWIIKNSWGTNYGEGGYVTVAYGAANTGSSVTQMDYQAPPVSINLTGGIDGAELMGDEMYELTWNTSGAAVSNVDIWLGLDGHCHDVLVAENVPNTGSYAWEVPNESTSSANIMIHPSNGGTEEGFGITQNDIKILGHKVRYVSDLGSNTAPYETPGTAAHTIYDALVVSTGVDTLRVTAGEYPTSLTISGPVTLMGGFSDDFAVRDSDVYVSKIMSGVTGLRFLSGSGNLGAVDGFLFEDCSAAISSDPVGGQHGGAIVVNNCSPSISNCTFNTNRAHPSTGLGYGGAICVIGGEAVVNSSTFTGNVATKGGAIGVFNGAILTLNQCEFDGNACSNGFSENVGGGIYVEDSALLMNGGHLSGGTITYQGGGLYATGSTIEFNSVDLSDNQASSSGGAVLAINSVLNSSGTVFSGNISQGGTGGGISSDGSVLNLANTHFVANQSLNYGGGLAAMGASGSVENCFFEQNSSSSGGGLLVGSSGSFVFRNNIVMTNQGDGMIAVGEFMDADYNNVVGNLPSNYGSSSAGAHDLSLDPVFVNVATGDFGLGQFSPCVDSGQDDASCLDPDGSRADMGLLGGPAAVFVAPDKIVGAVLTELSGGQVRVVWDSSTEENIAHYVVYRDSAEIFIPTPLKAVATVDHPLTTYEDTPPFDCYYLVVAVDDNGYSGGYSERVYTESGLSAVGGDMTPKALSITGVVPNPFNPMANVKFDIPRSGKVQLSVFDLRGRMVRELISGQMEAGSHEVMWNGRDNRGQMSAAGVYFARLSSAGGIKTVKMVLAK